MAAEHKHTEGVHVPYGADGDGFYTLNTIGCFNVIDNSKDLVLESLKNISLPESRAFCIADFGTADGGTSMPLMREIVSEVRKRNANQEILVVYEDQPVNDFKSLFKFVHNMVEGGPPTYAQEGNVYVHACGTSFFEQGMPSASVHLAFSATAMHWLSKCPAPMSSALHHTLASPEETVAYQQQAALDWERIILHRAKELVPGGYAVIVNFAVSPEGYYLGNATLPVNMHKTFMEIWRDFVSEGKITEEEFKNTNFANYYRTLEECKKPFEDESSPVFKEGLELVKADTRTVGCPYNAAWKQGKFKDAKEWAKWYIPTTRTWSNSTFFSGLNGSRSKQERDAIVDELFDRYTERAAAAPEDHGMDYVHSYLVMRKKL